MTHLVIGLDIGTSSTKAVAVRADGRVVARTTAPNRVEQPAPGWFEQNAEHTWWAKPAGVLRSLLLDADVDPSKVVALAVSGLGPCLVPTDASGHPLRPAILYGIDTRAEAEIAELERSFGADRLLARGGSALSSQALGPKILWIRRHEPEVWSRTARWFGAASFLVHRLTGEYVVDRHTASQTNPLYDLAAEDWAYDWLDVVCPGLAMPDLRWATEIIGSVTPAAAASTGLVAGTPVLAGTIDAWAEAHSAGVRRPGDLMLMYGSTMFLIGVVDPATSRSHPGLWRTAGLAPTTSTLAAGMATSGLLTSWVAELTGRSLEDLALAAAKVPAGSDGLLLLPYFAGERSPIFDPGARGVLMGLTLRHGPGHLMRAAYEGIGFGVRHNLEAFAVANPRGATGWRVVAVGGGANAATWTQIVSDVTGQEQTIPRVTLGAAYGDALLAAAAVGLVSPETDWSEARETVRPRSALGPRYDERYATYRELYRATRPVIASVQADR